MQPAVLPRSSASAPPAYVATQEGEADREARSRSPSMPVPPAAAGRSVPDTRARSRGRCRNRARSVFACSVARSDLVEYATVGEELRLHLAPCTEHIRQGERVHLGKLGGVSGGHRRRTRSVEIPRFDLLRLWRVQELQVRLGDLPGAMRI